jgi:hypothetical protein
MSNGTTYESDCPTTEDSKLLPITIPIDHSQDNVSYQANVVACAVLTWVGAAVFVGARFYTRRVLLHVLGWEDWAILLSLVFAAICSAGMIERKDCRVSWSLAMLLIAC